MLKMGHILKITCALIVLSGTPALAQNAEAGKSVFMKKCASCHSDVKGKNGIGPSLFGVYGKKAGGVSGYSYSAALKASGIVWTPEQLTLWLGKPKAVVPGTKMGFAPPTTDAEKADLIAYLKSKK